MIRKARYLMKAKQLEAERGSIDWPAEPSTLPAMTANEYSRTARDGGRLLLALDGFVLDVSRFLSDHPGGDKVLKAYAGKEPSIIQKAYDTSHTHTSAAVHLSHMMRVARLANAK